MVQQWFHNGSTMVQQWFNNGSTMVQQWFNNGSTMVQQWFNNGSTMVQQWFNNGSTMVQQWFNNGSTMDICMTCSHKFLLLYDFALNNYFNYIKNMTFVLSVVYILCCFSNHVY